MEELTADHTKYDVVFLQVEETDLHSCAELAEKMQVAYNVVKE